MTMHMTDAELRAAGIEDFEPFYVHFFAPQNVMISNWNALSYSYGDVLLVTPTVQFLSRDRHGASWLELLDDPDAQVRRYGRVRFARGDWPDDLAKVEAGSPEEELAIAQAWRELWNLPTEEEREARRAELRQRYGGPPSTSRTLGFEPGDDHPHTVDRKIGYRSEGLDA